MFAECSAERCVGLADNIIKLIYLGSSGNIYIQGPADSNNLNCSLHGKKYMTLKGGTNPHPLFKEIYSTILTGVSLNKNLVLRVIVGSTNCEITYITME